MAMFDGTTMQGTEWDVEYDAIQLYHINEQYVAELTREDLLKMLEALDK